MWGYTVPDSLTIPSLVAGRFRAAGMTRVEVVNLSQPSFNATQGLITLLLELRGGSHPDAVVSLDGGNDVLVALREGRPGAVFAEGDLARRSAVGRRGFLANVVGLFRYSALLQRLARFARPPEGQREVDALPSCDTVAAYYENVVTSAEALGRQFGFTPVYVWQPHWATTRKRLTSWEGSIRAERGFRELMRQCTSTVESLMVARRAEGYVSLTRMFDQDTATIFLDEFGHLTPLGNERIADWVADLLTRQFGPPRTAPTQ
jgi:hypothetical protein